MKLIAGALVTAVLLSGCSKSEEIKVNDTSMGVYDPYDPNFPAPYCSDQENNDLDAKRLDRSPEQFSNLCGYVSIKVTDASRWADGQIEALYTTTPADIYSYDYRRWFSFRNPADAKEMYVGDIHRIKLFIHKYPEQEDNYRSFIIWCLFTENTECD